MTVNMELSDILRVYRLLDKLHDFFHRHEDDVSLEQFRAFGMQIYPELRDSYYHVIWEALPDEVKLRIMDGQDLDNL